jgi:hypothetical protein
MTVGFRCPPLAWGPPLSLPTRSTIIGNGGLLAIAARDAYNFATGDFSITARFKTGQAGTLVSRKTTEGGSPAYAGWLLVLKNDGSLKLATDNGYGFSEVDSVATPALNGQWHSVAAVRRSAGMTIYLDGTALAATGRGSLPSPLNVSSLQRVLIGNTDQQHEQFRQFAGSIDHVSLWNRALADAEIKAMASNPVIGPHAANLVGYWPLNGSFNDNSPIGNTAMPSGAVSWG